MIIMGGDHVFDSHVFSVSHFGASACMFVRVWALGEISFVEICQILWTSASQFFFSSRPCMCCAKQFIYIVVATIRFQSNELNSLPLQEWLYEVIKFLSFTKKNKSKYFCLLPFKQHLKSSWIMTIIMMAVVLQPRFHICCFRRFLFFAAAEFYD